MGIFNRVLSQLSRQKNEPEPEASKDRLFAQIHHYSALIRLQDERQLIEVVTEDRSNSFQSMIIGIDLYHQQLIIDEVSPKLRAPETLIGKRVCLRHHYNRQLLEISSDIVGWEEEPRSFLLDLPEDVSYRPRRQQQRIKLTANRVIKATVHPPYGAPWYSSVSNISSGGMRILVTGDLRNNLHKNKSLKDCHIVLDKQLQLHTPGRVKGFTYAGRPYRRTEISIAFEQMDEANQEIIAQFICHQTEAA